jgi:hypothetical protein
MHFEKTKIEKTKKGVEEATEKNVKLVVEA